MTKEGHSCDETGGCEAIIDEALFPGMQRELSELEKGQGTQDAQRVMALGAQFAIILTKTGEKFRDSPYYGLFQRYTALQEKI